MLVAAPATRPTIPAGPAEGTVVARIVFDGMPGEGVCEIAKGARLARGTSWSSVEDATRAVTELTAGHDVAAAGIFTRAGRFEAYSLGVNWGEGGTDFRPYEATWSDKVARTVAGRGLAAIVDGTEEADIMSEADFRFYERWAT